MRFSNFKSWVASLCVLALVGCGGGGGGGGESTLGTGAGTPVVGGTSTPAAADIVLSLSAGTIANNGSQTVVATVVAVDAKNNVLAGVPITVSADSGVVAPQGTKTGNNGTLNANVGIGSDNSNRVITVTAASGSKSKTAQLQVVNSAGGTGTQPVDLILTLSSLTIPNDGSQSVTARAIALDARRNVLPGVVVSFAVNQGATVAPTGSSTGADGVLAATVGTGGLAANRTVVVTASAAGLTRSADLQVVSVQNPAQPVASDLSLVLSSSTIENTGSATVTATATAVDPNRNALTGIPITFSVDGNAVIIPSGRTTTANGSVTATVGIGADFKNRDVTVTVASGGLVQNRVLRVVGAKISASLSPVVNAGTTKNAISYKVIDAAGRSMADQAVTVIASDGTKFSGQTDVNGGFALAYNALTAAGTMRFQSDAAGASLVSNVEVVVAGGVPSATGPVNSKSLTPNPGVVSVNAPGSAANQVQLRALFVGPENQPIPNIRVRFEAADVQSQSLGTVEFVGAFAYSDAAGVARGTFTPGQNSSPTDGVTIRACYGLKDEDFTPANPCPNFVTAKLTVATEALSVSIRTNNLIDGASNPLTYKKQYVVSVVDSAGQAKAGVQITPIIDLVAYYKGSYFYNGDIWQQRLSLAATEGYQYDSALGRWKQKAPTGTPSCPNEDVNRNGVREADTVVVGQADPPVDKRGEDLNWNGELDPRKADVLIRMLNSSTTDSSGLAVVQIEYGKSVATWIDFVITVTASGVGGTEAQARYAGLLDGVGNLPALATDVTSKTNPPAFVFSPYGQSSVCTDAK